MNSFYTEEELKEIGFKSFGNNVLISKKVSIYSPEKITIGSNVRIDDFCILSGKITIGNFVHIAAYVALFAGDEGIVIEDFAGLSSKVSVYAVTDDYSGDFLTNPTVPLEFRNVISKQVIIKKHSIIGASSVILPGVIINEGVSCGSCTLINRDLDSWSIYVGIPARKLKDRSKKILSLESGLIKIK